MKYKIGEKLETTKESGLKSIIVKKVEEVEGEIRIYFNDTLYLTENYLVKKSVSEVVKPKEEVKKAK